MRLRSCSVMPLCSHGAVRSFGSVSVRFPMRPLHAHGVNGVAGFLKRCRCRRRFHSSQPRNALYRNCMNMDARKTTHRLWNVSRGIVFASGSSVVYPRLPLMRHQSAPANSVTGPAQEGSTLLPTVFSLGTALDEPPAGRGAGKAQTRVATVRTSTGTTITTSTLTTATAVTASSTTTLVAEGATEDAPAAVAGAAEKPTPKVNGPITPPFTPLDFKIPDQVFQAARQAAEETPESFWNYQMYRGPGEEGALDAKVKVHYCTSLHTTERVLQQYFMNEKVLGFDLEWMVNATKNSGARKNVSLVQLASPSRIGLFHIAAYPMRTTDLVAPSLKKIMEDPEITKVGVCIKGDCTRLSEFLGIKTRGQFELSHLYKLVKYSRSGEYGLINKRMVSLATQVQECFGLPIFKGNDVRSGNWFGPLHMDQVKSSDAASDAYANLQLYAVLDHQRKNLDPVPPLPHHAELNIPIRLADGPLLTATDEQAPGADAAGRDKPGRPEDEVGVVDRSPGARAVKLVV
ncbi:ribonuclease H-like domain-containing protein [Chaetomium strumarium]|uniref:Ribonuclease H-like domain-containing protein n=1 Tax=Chaetomium strumarium TaxID=1170767 RepID=A0AAJ0M3X7_9PEZI|nr:ribonuclease H-like domain-containing protein [Chaetomium strumarium]